MKAYKGFDKNLRCRGFQYTIGEQYEEESAQLCKAGFHACENPLDCFRYYAPADSRFCEVDIEDNGERHGDDTEVCGRKIKIGAELDVVGIIYAAFAYVKHHCTDSKQGGNRSALQGGDCSALQGGNRSALQGGNRSALQGGNRSALQGGYRSALQGGYGSALQGGYRSALQGGDRSALQGGYGSALQGGYGSALQGGDWSALQGGYGSALQGGDRSALRGGDRSALRGGDRSALQGGDWSVVYGGADARVKAGKGSVLALQYWVDGELKAVKAEIVDGEKIKADTWYRLDNEGRFAEADEDGFTERE